MHKEHCQSFDSCCRGKHPTDHSPPPALRQQATSFTDQLIGVDVVESNKQEKHESNTKYRSAGWGLADQRSQVDKGK